MDFTFVNSARPHHISNYPRKLTELEPSDCEVASIRSWILCHVNEEGPNAFDDRDIERITHDDHYIRRFIAENFNDLTKARKNILETLRWRKQNGINDVTIHDVYPWLSQLTQAVVHNRDANNCKMLTITVRKHVKAAVEMKHIKTNFIYWLERMEREEYGSQLTFLFDMKDATLANVDLEFVRYMILVLDNYYPWLLGKVLIIDMPWMLNAVWKVIKGWLPSKAGGLVHMISRKSIGEFITSDQCPVEWGGTDFIGYEFQHEVDPSRKPWVEENSYINHLYYVRKRLS